MKTKRGIYHNLKHSKYSTSNNEVEYFFSSMLYLNKFMEGYIGNRVEVRKRIGKVIDISHMNLDYLADLHLYKEIEKRGYRVLIKGSEKTWQNCLIFAFQQVTRKSIKDYEEIQEQK